MKKYVFIFLLLIFPALVFADAALMEEAVSGAAAGNGNGGGQDFTYDFSEKDDLTDWYDTDNEAACSGTTCDTFTLDTVSDNLDAEGAGLIVYEPTQTDTLSQYSAFHYVAWGAYKGVATRVSLDPAENNYVIRYTSNTDPVLRVCLGSSCGDIKNLGTPVNGDDDDSFGMEVSGTDTATIWKMWHWDEQTTPIRANWDSAATGGKCCNAVVICTGSGAPHANCDGDGSTSSAVTACTTEEVLDTATAAGIFDGSPYDYADTGNHIGIYVGGAGPATLDDFMGGDVQ